MRVASVEVGDEVGGGFHALISCLTEVARRGDVTRFGCDAGQCVEGEDFDMGVVVAPGVVEDRDETFLGAAATPKPGPSQVELGLSDGVCTRV